MDRSARAFTLIELLVVITIIVVLLALLTPALDKAIYQAELAVCMANLHGVGTGAHTYAMEFKRSYPYRGSVEGNDSSQPIQLAKGGIGNTGATVLNADDRDLINPYISLKLLVDPLSQKVDLASRQTQDPYVFSSYNMFFGWGFTEANGSDAFRRIGGTFGWQGDRYNVLAGDRDAVSPDKTVFHNTHPDKAGVLTPLVRQNEVDPFFYGQTNSIITLWATNVGPRGTVDNHYMTDDNAVVRFTDVAWDEYDSVTHPDSRMGDVPIFHDGSSFATSKLHVPRSMRR